MFATINLCWPAALDSIPLIERTFLTGDVGLGYRPLVQILLKWSAHRIFRQAQYAYFDSFLADASWEQMYGISCDCQKLVRRESIKETVDAGVANRLDLKKREIKGSVGRKGTCTI